MNKLIEKPTIQDVFKSIWCDYQYPVTDMVGNIISLMPSQNIQDIRSMELAEQFVENVAKSEELPFVFDKSLEGTTLKKRNRLGDLFYNLLRQQNENPGEIKPSVFPPTYKICNFDRAQYKYEVSENLKILSDVMRNLNFNRASFTGDPMSIIGNEWLREGELINSVVIRLREATQRKNFKTKVAERRKESTQNFTKTKRYIERLNANSLSLYGLRMVTCYRSECANSITLENSAYHLMKFLAACETDVTLGSPVGWWWKREYMTDVGYRHYLIVFFDGQKTPYNLMWFQEFYGSRWCSVTGDQGTWFLPSVPLRDYERCSSQRQPHGYSDSPASLLSSMQRMLMRDIFLRLEHSQKFTHFGMGALPKLADGTPPHDTFMQPGRFSGDDINYGI